MFVVKKLKKKRQDLYDELWDLHYGEPSPTMYVHRRSKIEYEIACLDERIEFEQKMAPFKWMLYSFIAVTLGLLVWAYFKK